MADDLGGDALAHLALGLGIDRQREVGMGLDVDEARRDGEAGGVDGFLRRRSLTFGPIAAMRPSSMARSPGTPARRCRRRACRRGSGCRARAVSLGGCGGEGNTHGLVSRMRCSASEASGAPLIRDRSEGGIRNGPGSAAHHFVLRCARDTSFSRATAKLKARWEAAARWNSRGLEFSQEARDFCCAAARPAKGRKKPPRPRGGWGRPWRCFTTLLGETRINSPAAVGFAVPKIFFRRVARKAAQDAKPLPTKKKPATARGLGGCWPRRVWISERAATRLRLFVPSGVDFFAVAAAAAPVRRRGLVDRQPRRASKQKDRPRAAFQKPLRQWRSGTSTSVRSTPCSRGPVVVAVKSYWITSPTWANAGPPFTRLMLSGCSTLLYVTCTGWPGALGDGDRDVGPRRGAGRRHRLMDGVAAGGEGADVALAGPAGDGAGRRRRSPPAHSFAALPPSSRRRSCRPGR